ncbi:hypothetical protein PENSUB_11821 [Penicillium subrubescens]|uniref:Uncharacterized protein n=1 Tax=Penicillium subrubescens TaxID=1316194 RepID=A0A1Q5T2U6_9EURO|nr:hypothetical protein PENSUB_11821 [Penicillium subrubescens]
MSKYQERPSAHSALPYTAGNLTSAHGQAKFDTIDLARAKRPVDHGKTMLLPLNNHDDLQILKFVPGGEQLSTEMIG